MQIVADKAKEARRENFERAMFLDQKIAEGVRNGDFTSQAAYDKAMDNVFRQTGIKSGALQRQYMNQETTMHREARKAALAGHSKMTGLSPEELDSFMMDDGNGNYVLRNPDFVAKMSTNRTEGDRLKEMNAQTNAMKLQTAAIERENKDREFRRQNESKIRLRHDQLMKEEAARLSTKKDTGRKIPEKKVSVEELPQDVKTRLLEQAVRENPLTAQPSG
jgi:hypothetical protein